MGNTWTIQLNAYHVKSYIRLHYKENGHQQDYSWRVYLHTANALNRVGKLQIGQINHISRE